MKNTPSKKKRWIVLAILFVLLLSALGVWAWFSGYDYEYELLEDGTVEIFISSRSHLEAPWVFPFYKTLTIPSTLNGYAVSSIGRVYDHGTTTIVIPDGVTSIGASAFADCDNLTKITIPDSVTSIGYRAFSGCNSLEHIFLNSVTSIGESAFSFCTSLKSIWIPEGVTSIGDGTFLHCTDLTDITLPYSIISINDRAFRNCSSLETVVIPRNTISIGSKAFAECDSLESITIPESVTFIADDAFAYRSSSSDPFLCYVEPNSYARTYCLKNNIPFYVED